MFVLAIGCLGASILVPFLALTAGAAILIGALISARRLRRWLIPIVATAVVAVALSATLLLVSWDPGSGPECPDDRCGELTPTSTLTDQG